MIDTLSVTHNKVPSGNYPIVDVYSDLTTGVRFLAGIRYFSLSSSVQIGSEAYPAFCLLGTRVDTLHDAGRKASS
jgi:hypothetical protein